MTTPQEIREWLRKMHYPDPNPSDEALQTLCRGAVGPIFQQIIDKVKPRQEVELSKKAILVHHLKKNTNVLKHQHDIEKLKLFYKKRKLEKELQQINAQNAENDLSLELLKSKITLKYAKQQTVIERIKGIEKDIVLFKAKIINLNEQIETCQKLREQSTLFERKNIPENDVIETRTSEVLSKLTDIISSFNYPLLTNLTTISENSTGSSQTSFIFSSTKQPKSVVKLPIRANSTRKNLVEITNNYLCLPSSCRKKSSSKLSLTSSFTSSIPHDSFINKQVDVINELEQTCWRNDTVKDLTEQLWESSCENVFKHLCKLKEKHRNKIITYIVANEDRFNDDDLKTINGIEKLYANHVATELKLMISQQELSKVQIMYNKLVFEDNISDISLLKATEFGLTDTIERVKNKIKTIRQEIPENSEKLNQILDEIQNVQIETETVKSKIDLFLNILRECNAALDKYKRNIQQNIKKPQSYSEYELLKSNIAQEEAEKFVSCPFQYQNLNYLNSWGKICSNPDLLELIKRPFLSPENFLKYNFMQKNWLRKLQLLEKETEVDKLIKILSFMNIECDDKQIIEKYQKFIEQLKSTTYVCSDVMKRSDEVNTQLKYFLAAPLNDCLAPNLKFENKSLKEYCELYDSYYKQIQ